MLVDGNTGTELDTTCSFLSVNRSECLQYDTDQCTPRPDYTIVATIASLTTNPTLSPETSSTGLPEATTKEIEIKTTGSVSIPDFVESRGVLSNRVSPRYGTVSIQDDRVISFIPTNGYTGFDIFSIVHCESTCEETIFAVRIVPKDADNNSSSRPFIGFGPCWLLLLFLLTTN